MKLKYIVLPLVSLSLLAACGATEEPTQKEAQQSQTETEEQASTHKEQQALQAETFFAKDGAKLHYRGEGSEFATLDVEVKHLSPNFVALYTSNGGSYVESIYTVKDEKVILLNEQVLDTEEHPEWTKKQLEALTGEVIIDLQAPTGTTFTFNDNTFRLTEKEITLETAYGKIENVYVLFNDEKEDFRTWLYYSPGIGLVKHHDEMDVEDSDEPFTVISELESIQ